MSTAKDILKEAIQLDPTEKAKLVDQLITSLDKPDKNMDKLWAEEAKYELDQTIEYYDFQSRIRLGYVGHHVVQPNLRGYRKYV